MTTKLAQKKYHHGDLKKSLIDAGIQILREKGINSLSLRLAARIAGVSQTAPYRHFESKEMLLCAIAERGFMQLADYLQKAIDNNSEDIRGQFIDIGSQYLSFALDEPALFRVMFSGLISYDSERYPKFRESGECAFGKLISVVVRSQEDGLFREGDPVDLALYAWSSIHGYSMLCIDRQLDFLNLPNEVYFDKQKELAETLACGMRILSNA